MVINFLIVLGIVLGAVLLVAFGAIIILEFFKVILEKIIERWFW